VDMTLQGVPAQRAVTSYHAGSHQFHIKIANYNNASLTYDIQFASGITVAATYTLDVLWSNQGPGAYNTLDDPTNVAPVRSHNLDTKGLSSLRVPEWSFVIVHIACESC